MIREDMAILGTTESGRALSRRWQMVEHGMGGINDQWRPLWWSG